MKISGMSNPMDVHIDVTSRINPGNNTTTYIVSRSLVRIDGTDELTSNWDR